MALTQYWRGQSKGNRQGSGMEPIHWPSKDALRLSDDPQEHLSVRELELHDLARCVYKERLAMGVAREQARKDLPLSTYTEAYWKIDLHNLFHFLEKRLHRTAQQEIREYAKAITQFVSEAVPDCWIAFTQYRLEAEAFSAYDVEALRRIIRDLLRKNELPSTYPAQLIQEMHPFLTAREMKEFLEKLERMV
jgi:thymidylate synthase (FAD)